MVAVRPSAAADVASSCLRFMVVLPLLVPGVLSPSVGSTALSSGME